MKNNFNQRIFIMLAAIIINVASLKAQNKPSIAILHIESHGLTMDSAIVAGLTSIELGKINQYNVEDKYDVADAIHRAGIDLTACGGRECLAAVGKAIHVDKVLSGSIEHYPNKIVISMRIIDVASGEIEKNSIREFLDLPVNLQQMIGITIQSMVGLPVDKETLKSLTQEYNYENAVNNPNESTVNLSGPRTGFTLMTGDLGKAYQIPEEAKGYGMSPWLWNFGWQLETQFVNSGYSQALFEFLFNVAGVEKGRFIPSATLFIGYRNNKYGLEAGVGPIVSLVRRADMSYSDSTGVYHKIIFPSPQGTLGFSPGLVVAVGKTFKSGRMNFPVNIYAIPRNEGMSYGISCGFNVKKK